jgi:hypothetical protein
MNERPYMKMQPPNKALKLTGHCYDLDRRGSPAA